MVHTRLPNSHHWRLNICPTAVARLMYLRRINGVKYLQLSGYTFLHVGVCYVVHRDPIVPNDTCYGVTWQHTPTRSKKSTFRYTHLAPISSTLGYEPWYHGETNDYMSTCQCDYADFWCVSSATHVPCIWSLVCTICHKCAMWMKSRVNHLLHLYHVYEVWCVPSANHVPCTRSRVCIIC